MVRAHRDHDCGRLRGSWKPGLSRRDVLVMVLVIGTGFLFIFPYLFDSRMTARRRLCDYRQMSLGRALLRYEAKFGEFPGYRDSLDPGQEDAPIVGWTYAILPYVGLSYQRKDIEYVARDDKRLGPWNDIQQQDKDTLLGTRKRELSTIYIPDLVCPDDLPPHLAQPGKPIAWASFVVNGGLPDALPESGAGQFPADWPANGMFQDGVQRHPDLAKVTLESIQSADGAANTLMLSENIDSGLWTAGEEARLTFLWVARSRGGIPDRGNQLLGLNQRGGQGQGSGKLLFARPSSRHRGGVNVVYADGHTEFLSEEIDYAIYTYKMTVNGQQLRYPGTDRPIGPPYQQAGNSSSSLPPEQPPINAERTSP